MGINARRAAGTLIAVAVMLGGSAVVAQAAGHTDGFRFGTAPAHSFTWR